MITTTRPRVLHLASRVAIIGASVRAAAQSTVAAGWDVVAADLFADADLCALCPATRVERYPEGFADWLAGQDVDGWYYTGGLENHPELVDRMAAIKPLWGVAGQPLRDSRDPFVLSALAERFGVLWPETVRAGAGERDGVWLAKTYRQAGGSGVARLASADEWRGLAERGAVAQRFVAGRSLSALFAVSASHSTLLGCTQQLLGDESAPWSYRGSIGPLVIADRMGPALEGVGRLLGEGLGLTGIVGADLIDHAERLWMIEVNPRWTASVEVLERAAGESLFPAHVVACRGETAPSVPRPEGIVGKQVVIAAHDAVATEAFHDWGLEECDAGRAADVPHAGDRFERGDPVLTVFAEGDDPEWVRGELAERAAAALRRLD
ncbi:MAG: ATP-grasp domain-containing protein [Lacipirellulaceae bacterium]